MIEVAQEEGIKHIDASYATKIKDFIATTVPKIKEL